MTDKEINKSDNYSYHEALHMSFVFGDTIERHLLSHPVIQKHKDIKKYVRKATEHLAKAYMLIGSYQSEND